MRAGVRLGLDWGEARIGVAACDPAGTLAFPVATVPAGPAAEEALLALVEEYRPMELVVGLPRSLSGGEGPAAVRIRSAAAALASLLERREDPVPVRLVDERLTTVSAARQLREAGRRAKQQRGVIDSAAATGILEHALAVERAGGKPPGELLSRPDASFQPPDEELHQGVREGD
jgi:putative holliday junction resolvase